MTSENLTIIQCPCADKYDLKIWREKFLGSCIMRSNITYVHQMYQRKTKIIKGCMVKYSQEELQVPYKNPE